MITIVINRITGERKVTDSYNDPSDTSTKVIVNILAKMIIEHGLLNKHLMKEK